MGVNIASGYRRMGDATRERVAGIWGRRSRRAAPTAHHRPGLASRDVVVAMGSRTGWRKMVVGVALGFVVSLVWIVAPAAAWAQRRPWLIKNGSVDVDLLPVTGDSDRGWTSFLYADIDDDGAMDWSSPTAGFTDEEDGPNVATVSLY